MVLKKKEKLVCPNCGSENIIYDPKTGEYICKDCGYVIKIEFDLGPEWRHFDDETVDRRRGGAPLSYAKVGRGLSTEIGDTSEIYKLKGELKQKFMRMRKWHSRVALSAIDRNLKIALHELKKMVDKLNMPKYVEEEAARIYQKVVEKGLARGRNINTLLAGTLYLVIREYNIPRTLEELEKATGISKKDIAKAYRLIVRELGIKPKPISPADFVYRYASELNLPPEVTATAIEIIEEAKKKNIVSGRGPQGIAAAALYIAAIKHGKYVPLKKIGEIAKVTEVTIKNRYKEIINSLGIAEEIEKKRLQLENYGIED
ncbi:NEQ276 [Nanoarchaeum equitans Kin4-M]|uniref:Transcription initiation factor IIB n=1 Tax=Nanoarchaeum equitans (strain Kin4-M) TaxID=228908 RepID=Q74NG0_NANEQ|nr:NEQ276 [Nanoarchaeum equitans Kin4-M]